LRAAGSRATTTTTTTTRAPTTSASSESRHDVTLDDDAPKVFDGVGPERAAAGEAAVEVVVPPYHFYREIFVSFHLAPDLETGRKTNSLSFEYYGRPFGYLHIRILSVKKAIDS
jgi:hypothetical protein